MKNKTATVNIDVQLSFTNFCPEELPVPGGETLAPILNEMAALGCFRVGSKDAHGPNPVWATNDPALIATPTGLAEAPLYWPSHCVVGTKGFELLDGLPRPEDFDFFVWKGIEKHLHPFGICYHSARLTTGVIEVLQVRGIERVIVGGLAFDFCVKDTAIQLAKAGFEVIVVREACRAIADESAEAATQAMLAAGVEIVETIKELSKRN